MTLNGITSEAAVAIVGRSLDAIVTLDTTGVVLAVNPATTTLFGYGAHELVGQPTSMLLAEPWRGGHAEFLRGLVESGEKSAVVSRRTGEAARKDGSVFPVQLTIAEFHVGSTRYFVKTFQDITSFKAAEQELERSNRSLEEFAYVASHDLQSPVRNISGLVQLLRDCSDDEKDEYLDLLDAAANRARAQVQGLLVMSRLQRRDLTFGEVSLTLAARAALSELTDDVHESGAQVLIDDQLPAVSGDPALIALVFKNLIGNAIKYRHLDVAPIVRVETGTTNVPAGRAEVVVRDNGIGIDPTQHDRVFKMFQRLHAESETAYVGTGIGLALVKKIVDDHHGRVWIVSDGKGTGSAFHVQLPTLANVDRVQLSTKEETRG